MSLNFKPTGSWLFMKKPQFVEETTFGVLPLNNGAAGPTVFTSVGHLTEATKEPTPEQEMVRVLGSRDLFSCIKLGVDYAFSMSYRPVSTGFMRYGTQLPDVATVADPGPATARNGTNGVSISILTSALINGTEKFLIYKGCHTDSITVTVSRTGGVEVEQSFRCADITGWIAEPTFSPACTYAADPTGDPWTSLTGGTTPLQIDTGSGNVEFKTDNFEYEVNQNLGDVRPNGTPSLAFLGPTNREITMTADMWVKDSVLYDAMLADTNLPAVTYTLNTTGPKTAAFSNNKITGYTSTATGGTTDFLKETITFVARTMSTTL
jgi:hypothetical protein